MMRWPGAAVVPIKVVSCGLSPTPVLEFVLAGREGVWIQYSSNIRAGYWVQLLLEFPLLVF